MISRKIHSVVVCESLYQTPEKFARKCLPAGPIWVRKSSGLQANSKTSNTATNQLILLNHDDKFNWEYLDKSCWSLGESWRPIKFRDNNDWALVGWGLGCFVCPPHRGPSRRFWVGPWKFWLKNAAAMHYIRGPQSWRWWNAVSSY